MHAKLRPGLVAAATVLLLCSAVRSQNGTNYHILTNGPDVARRRTIANRASRAIR